MSATEEEIAAKLSKILRGVGANFFLIDVIRIIDFNSVNGPRLGQRLTRARAARPRARIRRFAPGTRLPAGRSTAKLGGWLNCRRCRRTVSVAASRIYTVKATQKSRAQCVRNAKPRARFAHQCQSATAIQFWLKPPSQPASSSWVGETPWRERPYQTIANTADLSCRSKASVYGLINRGLLRAAKLEGKTVIETGSLIALFERAESWDPDHKRVAAANKRRAEISKQ
jgi:hypothetical protein